MTNPTPWLTAIDAARYWQAGDLVRRANGTWHFIEWVDNGEPISKSDGCTCLGAQLLAPAGGDLWEALRGLAENAAPGDWYLYIPLTDHYCLHISTPESNSSHRPFMRGPVDHSADALPQLEQAIQRFKALHQYIQEATCSKVTT